MPAPAGESRTDDEQSRGCPSARFGDGGAGDGVKLNAYQAAEFTSAGACYTHAEDVSATDHKTGVVKAYAVASPAICLEACGSDERAEQSLAGIQM